MKDLDSKMENNELSTSDIIPGSWVLKRKRKKIPSSRQIMSNANTTVSVPLESTSPNGTLKKESSSHPSPTKEKGNDGVSFSSYYLIIATRGHIFGILMFGYIDYASDFF